MLAEDLIEVAIVKKSCGARKEENIVCTEPCKFGALKHPWRAKDFAEYLFGGAENEP